MDKIFNKILNENEMVNNLTAVTEQVEMFKNLKEQIKKARNLRIKELKQMVKNLHEIIESKESEIKLIKAQNKKIEEAEEYKDINKEYSWKHLLLFVYGDAGKRDVTELLGYNEESVDKEYKSKLEKIGYISDIEEREKEILEAKKKLPDYIEYLYEKYLCAIFGHEYKRYKGKIDYEKEGGRRARYSDEDLCMYDERELIDSGYPGTCYAVCKYCGRKIEELDNPSFPLDYIDLQKVNIIFEAKNKK